MFVLLRNLLTISILFLSTSFLYARDIKITEDTFKQDNDKVAFLFGLFGSSSSEGDDEEDENSGLSDFAFSEDGEEGDFAQETITQEPIVDTNVSEELEPIVPVEEVVIETPESRIASKRASEQKSLRGKSYYMSASYSLLLKGKSVTDYFSMEEEDPEDEENDNLVPVYSTDDFNASQTAKTSVAVGKYYSGRKSYLEFEYTKFYMRAADYKGDSVFSASDDRLYRSWVSGLAIWKRDLVDFNMIGMKDSSPFSVYSILGAGYTYTTLSKKETNKIQFAYTLGAGVSWRLNTFTTLYGDLRYTANVSSMQTFTQGYDQSHNVNFTDLNLGARFFIF